MPFTSSRAESSRMVSYDFKERIFFSVIVQRSRIDRFGVFARQIIPARRKIGEISGDIIPLKLCRMLYRGKRRLYYAELSTTEAINCANGNNLRFLNHSCDSNAFVRLILNRIEVYARRMIQCGEEITIDYGETPHVGGMKCRCDSLHCRGRL